MKCIICNNSFPGGVHYLNKDICNACVQGLNETINKSHEEHQEERLKCTDCGHTFFTAEPNWYRGKPYCFLCVLARVRENNTEQETQQKQQTKHCIQCGKAYNTDNGTGYNGTPYCYSCYRVKEAEKQKEANDFFKNLFGEYTQFSYTTSDTSRTSYTHTFTSNTSTSYISKEVQEAFKLLGLQSEATQEDIKKAFKAKALVTHPDTGGTHEDMVKLNKAKDVCLEFASQK